MSKIKYDVSDVEGSGNFEAAPIGVFPAKITKFVYEEPEDKDNRFVVTAQITDPEGKYFPLTDYVLYDSAGKFRWRQLCDALGLPAKGEVDDVKGTVGGKKILGALCQIKTRHETWEDEVRAKVGIWLPAKAKGGVEKAAAPEENPDTAEGEAETWADIGAQIDAGETEEDEMRTAAAEYDIDPDAYETWAEVGELMDAADAEGGAEEPEDAEAEAEPEDEEDLEALAALLDEGEENDEGYAEAEARLRELAAEIEGLDPDEYETWAEVVEIIGAADEGEGGGGEDYENMSLVELKAACRKAEISPTGKREELIERLQAYAATDPFASE